MATLETLARMQSQLYTAQNLSIAQTNLVDVDDLVRYKDLRRRIVYFFLFFKIFFTSCQPHGVTSGRTNTMRCPYVRIQNSSYVLNYTHVRLTRNEKTKHIKDKQKNQKKRTNLEDKNKKTSIKNSHENLKKKKIVRENC